MFNRQKYVQRFIPFLICMFFVCFATTSRAQLIPDLALDKIEELLNNNECDKAKAQYNAFQDKFKSTFLIKKTETRAKKLKARIDRCLENRAASAKATPPPKQTAKNEPTVPQPKNVAPPKPQPKPQPKQSVSSSKTKDEIAKKQKREREAAEEAERMKRAEEERIAKEAEEEALRQEAERRRTEDKDNMGKGDEYFNKGQYSNAKFYYEKVVEYDLSTVQEKIRCCNAKIQYDRNIELGDKAFKYEEYAEAREYYRKAMAYNPEVKVRVEECDRRIEKEEALQQMLDSKRCPAVPSVTDYDGNTYRTVKIGAQCWMAENLRTTHYSDGTGISLGDTLSQKIAYRYYPNGDASRVPKYGYLYNWQAVMKGAKSSSTNPSGVQGICPKGWHVPSLWEWDQLMKYLVCQGYSRGYGSPWDDMNCGLVLFSPKGWEFKFAETQQVDVVGFSAIPAGAYYLNGAILFGTNAFFGSTRCLDENVSCVTFWAENRLRCYLSKEPIIAGLSIRCVYDSAFMEEINEANCGTVTDYDGNTYHTVQIGNQCWMKENLRCMHYADGTKIKAYNRKPQREGYRYVYYKLTDAPRYTKSWYGFFYNYHAAVGKTFGKKNAPNLIQGICPNGWHLPNQEEWEQLKEFAESQDGWMLYDEQKNRGFAKAFAMNNDCGWRVDQSKSHSIVSVPGDDIRFNNLSGFSAPPAGEFSNKGWEGYGNQFKMWVYRPDADKTHYSYMYISGNSPSVYLKTGEGYQRFFSVRCLRD